MLLSGVLVPFLSNSWEKTATETIKAGERTTSLSGTDVLQTHQEGQIKKGRCMKARTKIEKSEKNVVRMKALEDASREERQLQQAPANPESLRVSSSWENKKRASACQSHTCISHRWREKMSHRDVAAVTINPRSLSSAFIHKGIQSRFFFKKKKKANTFFLFCSFASACSSVASKF